MINLTLLFPHVLLPIEILQKLFAVPTIPQAHNLSHIVIWQQILVVLLENMETPTPSLWVLGMVVPPTISPSMHWPALLLSWT